MSGSANRQPPPAGSIAFERVRKSYPILTKQTPRAGSWLFSKAFEYFRREPFEALCDVSLRIEPGDMVAFVGRNGAGKSTILKLISGITLPDHGSVRVGGPVASLLELGVGFHPELSGIENIFYSATMLGLTRKQLAERIETIVDFSGIEPFLFQPVKYYSSGMYSRLGLSVALHMDAPVILMDEVLGVGDADFQHKTFERVLGLNRAGTTIVIVTHDPNILRDLCNKGFWIEDGRIRAEGKPLALYEEFSAAMAAAAARESLFGESKQSEPIASVELSCDSVLRHGEPWEAIISAQSHLAGLRLGLRLRRPDGLVLFEDLSEPMKTENGYVSTVYRIDSVNFGRGPALVDLVVQSVDDQSISHATNGVREVTIVHPDYGVDHYVLVPEGDWKVSRIDDTQPRSDH